MTTTIELTPKEAKEFKTASGMYGFALAVNLKKRAMRKAAEAREPCAVICKGEVLFTAQVPTEEK
jgi:hypothetical protein